MKKSMIYFLIFSLPILLVSSCNKDKDMDDEPEYIIPSSAERAVIIEIPAGLAAKAEGGDYNAFAAISYMNLANTVAGFSSIFAIPADAKLQSKKSNSYVYFWSMSGYSYWMTYSNLPDKYTWTYDYQFPEVPRFTYMYAEESKSGKQGSWSINSPEQTGVKLWSYVWNITPANSFQAVVKLNDNGSTNEGQFEVTANDDKSGSFFYKIGNQLHSQVIWNANGSGSYLIMDGEEEIVGMWN